MAADTYGDRACVACVLDALAILTFGAASTHIINNLLPYFQINKPAAFTVDFNGAHGKLDARVVAPSGAEDEAIIQEVDKGE